MLPRSNRNVFLYLSDNHTCVNFPQSKFLHRKTMGPPAVVFKKIQGGIQPDISLRLTGNFPWSLVSIVLRPYGGTSNKQFPFRAEMKYGSKQWSKRCKNCLVRAWQHKRYTNVRIQFCRDYYGVPLQFIAQAETLCAATTTPIVTFKPGKCNH